MPVLKSSMPLYIYDGLKKRNKNENSRRILCLRLKYYICENAYVIILYQSEMRFISEEIQFNNAFNLKHREKNWEKVE